MIQDQKLNAFASAAKLLTITLLLTTPALAVDKKVDRAALPPAVQKTVDTQARGATIKGYSMETEKGKTTYEVEMTVNGHGKDVEIAKNGSIVEVEEEMPLASLPAAAKSAMTTKAAAAKIVKVEAVTRGGKLAAYEADTVNGAKKREIAVGPNGEDVKDED